ncbi:MAG: hypothetical protein K8S21_11430 [Gemmatimonadetes bacterium]|nr:hypothetical protein [Gemmatimonadota bacterium]
MTMPPLPPEPAKDKDAKKREKEAKRLEAERGPLEPAFRYKAILNALEAGQDMIELADRKARFALVIISVLNAVALVVVVRGGDSFIPRFGVWGTVTHAEIVAYVLVTIYYIFQAIEALRPRGSGPTTDALPTAGGAGESMRVLFHGDIVRRDRAAFRKVWDELRMDNLNTELADQLHTIARINQDKYAALAKLYRGVTIMTAFLTATLVTIAAWNLTR